MGTLELGGQTIALEAHVDVWLLCAGLVLGYVGLVRRWGALLTSAGEPAVTRRQAVWFGLGVLGILLASGSPLHDLADRYLWSAHMVQHLLQAFVIAPLLWLGTPGWMFEVLTRPRWLRGFVRTFAQPLVAAIAFNLILIGMHWPAVVTAMVDSGVFHGAVHTTLLLTSLLMWLPLLSPSEAVVPRLNPLPRLGYLFAQTLLPTVPASFMTFGDPDVPLYPVYAQFPRLWDIPVGQDMLISGLIMKIGGGFLLWGIIAVVFFRWAAEQERADREGAGAPPASAPPTADLSA